MERQNITIKQLECLVAIDRTSHFRQAAELLNIQQPTLSQQLQNIEMGVLEEQVVDHIVSQAQVENVESNYEDVLSGRAIIDPEAEQAEAEAQADTEAVSDSEADSGEDAESEQSEKKDD